ncbi:SusC/RagA family TonB-linked outer membrane protein [Chitinophaga rhizophila]|uniref:SusC/RagA family TonB-linked outer membrane protein n=1 Tax=Chitinophaga rhizophila TaxID=2866212 RepID=A0ABS7GKC4_9BACT|nr:SusC/RagA family TonB-linked outer membrane protein [Chitinophaga rhizophila]MBW8688179.1 SusC/RagA family TonB-linked outer membrane protein [Chitinophaga rhizophila]
MGMPTCATRCTLLLVLFTCCLLQVKGQLEQTKVSVSGKQLPLQHIFNTIQAQTNFYFSYNADIDVTQLMDVHFVNTPLSIVLHTILRNKYAWTLDGHSINLRKLRQQLPPATPSPPADTPKLLIGKALDETVVIAYGTTTLRFATGNLTAIKAENIAGPAGANILLALQGRVPGLLITQTGGIGGMAMKVQLRGQNSLVNGTQPLYIVDGIPFNPVLTGGLGSFIWGENASAFNFINPEDVESIEVLKDADATAIYGSRGANGVILINTRKGRIGKTRLRLNIAKGITHTARKVKLLNTAQYLEMRREAFLNDGVAPNERNAPDLLQWNPHRYTDWQHALIGGTGNNTSAHAAVSGGTTHGQYLLSSHYRKESLVFPGAFGNTRGGMHISTNTWTPDNRFNAAFTGSFLADRTMLPGFDFTSRIMLPPNTPPPYLEDGSLNYAWLNPYIALVGPTFDAHVTNLLANVGLQYRLLPGLSLKTTMGYNWLTGRSSILTPLAIYPPAIRNTRTGSSRLAHYESVSRIIEPQVTYTHDKADWYIQALAGGTLQGYNESRETLNADGFKDDALLHNIYYADTVYGKKEGAIYRYLALFGRLSLRYHNRYLLNLSVRRDGSSRFGPRKQFAVFGAVGAGWIFTEEKFMQPLRHILSFGKLRSSYGTTGNDQIGDYQYLGQYNPTDGTYQDVTGLTPARLFNADFAWELTRKSEAGIELGFLHDKLLFSASYYVYRSSNQLVSYPLPDITGAGNIIGNLPVLIRNSGLELALTTQHIKRRRFEWASSFNISFCHNKLINYPDPTIPIQSSFQFVEGQALSQQYVADAMGVDPLTGTYLFADAHHHPVPADKAAETHPVDVIPVCYGGWQHDFRLGNFGLQLLLQFTRQQGVNTTFDPDYMPGYQRNQYAAVLSRWRQPGDVATHQRYTQLTGLRDSYKQAISSDMGYEDASYIRCRFIEANWSLPAAPLARLHLHDVKLYLQAQNLFTLTRYSGLDPETQSRTTLPPLRGLACGLKIAL